MRPGTDQSILCASVRFRPARGPGGVRKIEAVVTRAGVPVEQRAIASFQAPKQSLPSRPGALRARRGEDIVLVALPRSRGATRLAVSAALSDGRVLAYDLDPSCQAVVIDDVPAGIAATVRVGGVRYDLAMGELRSVSLRRNAVSAGPRGKLPRRLWRPRKVCT